MVSSHLKQKIHMDTDDYIHQNYAWMKFVQANIEIIQTNSQWQMAMEHEQCICILINEQWVLRLSDKILLMLFNNMYTCYTVYIY